MWLRAKSFQGLFFFVSGLQLIFYAFFVHALCVSEDLTSCCYFATSARYFSKLGWPWLDVCLCNAFMLWCKQLNALKCAWMLAEENPVVFCPSSNYSRICVAGSCVSFVLCCSFCIRPLALSRASNKDSLFFVQFTRFTFLWHALFMFRMVFLCLLT